MEKNCEIFHPAMSVFKGFIIFPEWWFIDDVFYDWKLVENIKLNKNNQKYKPTTSQGLGVFLFGSSTLVFACRKVVTQNLRKEVKGRAVYRCSGAGRVKMEETQHSPNISGT